MNLFSLFLTLAQSFCSTDVKKATVRSIICLLSLGVMSAQLSVVCIAIPGSALSFLTLSGALANKPVPLPRAVSFFFSTAGSQAVSFH